MVHNDLLARSLRRNKGKNRRRRIILQHDNASSSHTSAQTTAYLTGQNIEFMGPLALIRHPMTSFYSLTSKINCVINVFRRLNKQFMRSKCMFRRYLNRSGKSASKYPYTIIFWIDNVCVYHSSNVFDLTCPSVSEVSEYCATTNSVTKLPLNPRLKYKRDSSARKLE